MSLINWKDVNEAYPESAKLADATQADSVHVYFAVSELESRMAQRFTVPFSINNLTAKDLAIDLTMMRLFKYKEPKKYDSLKKAVDERIAALFSGLQSMVLADGTTLQSVGGTVYSTTEDYHPVFGMSPIELSVVDSQQINDEETDRGFPV